MMLTVVYFVIALFVLITVHEYGHFLAARLCGVKVLRFSFGFGKVLASFKAKSGTEYVWSMLPLGGYVKMLDANEGEVAAHEQHLAFNNKSVLSRIIIVIAGPIFNFLFAFLALWLVLVIGIHSLAPIIDSVKSGSLAEKAGFAAQTEILAIDKQKINSWRDVQFSLLPLLGSDQTISVTTQSLNTGNHNLLKLNLADWHMDTLKVDPLTSLGIKPFIPAIPLIIGQVMPGSPAMHSELKAGDKILMANGKEFTDWLAFVDYIKKNPGKKLALSILRNNKVLQFNLSIGSKETNRQREGFLGLMSKKVDWPKKWLRLERQPPLTALVTAYKQTVNLIGTTFTVMGRFITGKIGLQHVSGPVGMAQGAGESARSGLTYYLSFLALVSISLGVLNLLPIPMLDGGHLLFYVIEIITNKSVSAKIKTIGFNIGLFFLVFLTVLALCNDVARLIG